MTLYSVGKRMALSLFVARTVHTRFVAACAVLIALSLGPFAAQGIARDTGFEGYRRIDTEYFRIIYEPRDRESAAAIAQYADDAYEELAAFLQNWPSRRIRVWINGRTDVANGYFMPAPPNHIAVFVASPTTPWIGARTENWLRAVFIHELAHHMHFMYQQGLRSPLSRVFGEPLLALPGVFLPGWAIEGIAIEAETRFTEGGRGRSPYFEHYYAAPILEDRFFDYRRAAFDSHRPPRGRFYVAGYIMVDYLIEEYGDDVFARIHQEFLRPPLFSWDRAIAKVTGVSAEHNYRLMKRRLEERYAWRRALPAGAAVSPQRIGHYHLPRIAADGVYVYRTRPDRPAAIVRLDSAAAGDDEGKSEVVRTGPLVDGSSFDVSPDGTRILFSAYRSTQHHRGPQRQNAELYLWEEGAGVRAIDGISGVHHPALVDERWAVAVQRRGADHRLVWVDLEHGGVSPLYEPEGMRLYWPQPAPEGARLVFTENNSGTQLVRELDLPARGGYAGRSPRTIPTPAGRPAYQARYAGPDRLLFSLETDGPLVLYEWRREATSGARQDCGRGCRAGDNCTAPGDQNLRPLLADQVGVLAGELHNNTLYYATYRSDGYAVRSIASSELPAGVETAYAHRPETYPRSSGANPELPFDSAAAAGNESTESLHGPDNPTAELTGERRFWNAPRLGFWLPIPAVLEGAQQDLYWGGGILALGGTFVDPASVHFVASYHPEVEQVFVDAAARFRYGRAGVSTAVRHRYELVEKTVERPGRTAIVKNKAEQRSEAELIPSVVLYGAQERGVQRQVSLYGFGAYTLVARADEDFALRFDAPPGGSSFEYVELGGGLQARRSGPSSQRDLYPSRLLSGRLQVARDLPEFGNPAEGLRPHLDAEVALPTARSGQSVSLNAGTLYSTGDVRTISPFAPPGFDGPVSDHNLPGWLRARISYRATLALTDIALPFGFNIGGFGAAVFAEQQAGYDLEREELQAQEAVYLGAELLTLLGYSIGRFPLRTGITVRLEDNRLTNARLYIGLETTLRFSSGGDQ